MPLRNIPKLTGDDSALLSAYDVIARSRTWGMSSPNTLSISDVANYCALMGIASIADRAKYLRITQDLDGVFMEHWAQNNKNKA